MVRTGKASEAVLDRCVRRVITPVREKRPKMATVCGNIGGSLDPTPEMYAAGVCNKLLSAGIIPETLSVDLMVPLTEDEKTIKSVMRSLTAFAETEMITLSCGHTQVSEEVLKPVLALTVCGSAAETTGWNKTLQGNETLDLCMAGTVGQAGTHVLAAAFEKELLRRFPQVLVEGALHIGAGVGSREIMRQAAKQSAAAYAVSQGGVFGALWEFASSMRWGFEVDLKQIPIRQETIEICEWADLNPYQLYGVGAFLIAAADGEMLCALLQEAGIPASVIGTVNGQNGRIIRNGEEVRYMDKPGQDMLWNAMKRYKGEKT